MHTPVTLDRALLAELAEIGKKRLPNEACGIITPIPLCSGQRVWEMPNRSLNPSTSYSFTSEDILIALEKWLEENPSVDFEGLVIWHTHPSGSSSPSRDDLQYKIEECGNLVVAWTESEVTATWY